MELFKVSIIVPFYNAECFLDECIQSVLKQTYENYELILVDDGSTDKSKEICGKYCNTEEYDTDGKIKYIYGKNSGVSAARNKGMKYSEGEFISFLDADDFLDESYIERLIKAQEKHNTDLTVCTFFNYKNKGSLEKRVSFEQDIYFGSNQIRKELIPRLFFNDYHQPLTNPVCRLYRKSIIIENNISFNEKLKLYEDRLFNYVYMHHISDFYYINEALYYRYVHPGSAMHKYRENIYEEMIDCYTYYISLNRTYEKETDLEIFDHFFARLFVKDIIILNVCHADNKEKFQKKWKKYYQFIHTDLIYEKWKRLRIKDFHSIKWWMIYILLRLRAVGIIEIMFQMKRKIKHVLKP